MFMPALIAGGALGFASGLPLVYCGCCVLAAGAGFLAALLYSKKCKQAGTSFAAGNGAGLGLLSGVIFGVVGGSVFSVFAVALGQLDPDMIAEQAAESPMADPEAIEQVTQLMESTGPALIVLVFLFVWVLLGAIFATLGGLIGGSVFKVEAAGDAWAVGDQPPPQDQAPPPPVQPGR
jgi:hypothetical protein